MKYLLYILQKQGFPSLSLTLIAVFHVLAPQIHQHSHIYMLFMYHKADFQQLFKGYIVIWKTTALTMTFKNPSKRLLLQKKFSHFNCPSNLGTESRIMLPAHLTYNGCTEI